MMTIPRFYIRDVTDRAIVALDEGDYFDDNLTRYLAGKASILTFSIYKDVGDYELYKTGKKLSFRFEEEDFWLNILTVEQDETILTITAVSLNLELNNEDAPPFKANQAMSFKAYFDIINTEGTFSLGLNEVSDKKITYEWTGTSTKLARLFSLATVFDAEVEFITELNNDGSLKNIIVNVYRAHSDQYQGIGTNRTNETFRFGEEIKTVRKTEDAMEIYTAIRPKGKDGLSIVGVEHEVFDENGNLLYCTYKTAKPGFGDPSLLYAPQSKVNFPSTIIENGDQWTVHDTDELEYENAEALYGYALSELKKNCLPKTTWEIEGYINARIGDTVRIADDGYKPELFLEARISEQSISFTNPIKNTTTFSNVDELASQISQDLISRMQALIEANKTYFAIIETTTGIAFKNGQGQTTLTARVQDGAIVVTNRFTIRWYKDQVFLKTANSITVNASDIAEKAVYSFVALDENMREVAKAEATVVNVDDGTNGTPGKPGQDGQTSYIHVAYADSADGKTGFSLTESLGKKYMGTYSDFNKTSSTDPTKYMWVELVGVIEIGGANYYSNIYTEVRSLVTVPSIIKNTANAPNGFEATPSAANSSLRISGVITSNGWWTISGYFRGSQSKALSFIISFCGAFPNVRTMISNANNSWKYFEASVDVRNYSTTNNYIDFSGMSANQYLFKDIMIEKGNRAGDWQQNQRDADYYLNNKVEQDVYDTNNSATWEEIGNRVTQEEANEIRNMAEAITNSYNSFVSSSGQYAKDLASLESRSAALVERLGDQLATYEFLKTYIKLGEEGLVIGSEDSSLKVLLSKDKLAFSDGGNVVAYFSNQSFFINRGAIVDSLQVGQHKIVSLNANHTIVRYVTA